MLIIVLLIANQSFGQVSSQLTALTRLPDPELGIIPYLQTIKTGAEAKLEEYQALRNALKKSKPEASALLTGIPPKFVKVKQFSDQLITYLQTGLVGHSWFRPHKKTERKWQTSNLEEPIKTLKDSIKASYENWMKSDDIIIPKKNTSPATVGTLSPKGSFSFPEATGTIADLIPPVWTVYKESRELSAKKIDGTVDLLEACRIGLVKAKEEKKTDEE